MGVEVCFVEIKVIILVGFLVRFFIRGDVVGNYDDYLGWWFEEFWRNFIVVIFDFLYENY